MTGKEGEPNGSLMNLGGPSLSSVKRFRTKQPESQAFRKSATGFNFNLARAALHSLPLEPNVFLIASMDARDIRASISFGKDHVFGANDLGFLNEHERADRDRVYLLLPRAAIRGFVDGDEKSFASCRECLVRRLEEAIAEVRARHKLLVEDITGRKEAEKLRIIVQRGRLVPGRAASGVSSRVEPTLIDNGAGVGLVDSPVALAGNDSIQRRQGASVFDRCPGGVSSSGTHSLVLEDAPSSGSVGHTDTTGAALAVTPAAVLVRSGPRPRGRPRKRAAGADGVVTSVQVSSHGVAAAAAPVRKRGRPSAIEKLRASAALASSRLPESMREVSESALEDFHLKKNVAVLSSKILILERLLSDLEEMMSRVSSLPYAVAKPPDLSYDNLMRLFQRRAAAVLEPATHMLIVMLSDSRRRFDVPIGLFVGTQSELSTAGLAATLTLEARRQLKEIVPQMELAVVAFDGAYRTATGEAPFETEEYPVRRDPPFGDDKDVDLGRIAVRSLDALRQLGPWRLPVYVNNTGAASTNASVLDASGLRTEASATAVGEADETAPPVLAGKAPPSTAVAIAPATATDCDSATTNALLREILQAGMRTTWVRESLHSLIDQIHDRMGSWRGTAETINSATARWTQADRRRAAHAFEVARRVTINDGLIKHWYSPLPTTVIAMLDYEHVFKRLWNNARKGGTSKTSEEESTVPDSKREKLKSAYVAAAKSSGVLTMAQLADPDQQSTAEAIRAFHPSVEAWLRQNSYNEVRRGLLCRGDTRDRLI